MAQILPQKAPFGPIQEEMMLGAQLHYAKLDMRPFNVPSRNAKTAQAHPHSSSAACPRATWHWLELVHMDSKIATGPEVQVPVKVCLGQIFAEGIRFKFGSLVQWRGGVPAAQPWAHGTACTDTTLLQPA